MWVAFHETAEIPKTTKTTQTLRGAKPGGFQTRVFPTFFGKGPDCVADPSGLFLVGALDRPRKRKGTNRENPRTIPEQIGKIPEKSGKSQKGQKGTKKEGQVQIGKRPRSKPPRLAALDRQLQSEIPRFARGAFRNLSQIAHRICIHQSKGAQNFRKYIKNLKVNFEQLCANTPFQMPLF